MVSDAHKLGANASKINGIPKCIRLSENCSTLMKIERSSNKFDLRMLQWASEFATGIIEFSVEIHK